MFHESGWKEPWNGPWQRGLLAGGAILMAVACLAIALWAALQFPPAGWLCYLMALGWSLIGTLCLSDVA